MNFLSMTYFSTAAREKSFTKAAEHLHITQQTLSAHISSLEKELGCRLFLRHVPLELTYAGEVFLTYALDFQKKYRDMLHEFNDISCNQKGVLRIGIAFTRGRAIMPQLIRAYQKEHPLVEIHLLESTNDMLHQSLLKGEIDLAVACLPDRMPGAVRMDFYEEEVILLISEQLLDSLYGPKKEERLEEVRNTGRLTPLADCPFLFNSHEDIAGRISRQLIAQAGFIPHIRAESSNIETLLALCADQAGACFCPDTLAFATLTREQKDTLHILHLGDSARYMIHFGWMQQSYQWSAIEDFTRMAAEITGK